VLSALLPPVHFFGFLLFGQGWEAAARAWSTTRFYKQTEQTDVPTHFKVDLDRIGPLQDVTNNDQAAGGCLGDAQC
jgi:hypothetical protein